MTSRMRPRPEALEISPEEAAAWLVGHLGLRRHHPVAGARGTREVLEKLRCIQLDPLDPMGTNADLVAMARVRGLRRGEVFRHLYPGHAFEHFAKERCLLPASAFPAYRDAVPQTPWWRASQRLERLGAAALERKLEHGHALIDEVLAEVAARGPISAAALTDRGRVVPIDWSGWKSTARANAMALDVLWTRCQLVVCGRGPKLYDLPARALPQVAAAAGPTDFARWAILERVEAAGLLSAATGAVWSMLRDARAQGVPEALVEAGKLIRVRVSGASRLYYAPANFRSRKHPRADGRIRILGPLDPLLWDRELLRAAFGFDYVWEVYKPKAQRRFGWYVCPLLQGDTLLGRLEGEVDGEALRIRNLWREPGRKLDEAALEEALLRHARACGAERVIMPGRFR